VIARALRVQMLIVLVTIAMAPSLAFAQAASSWLDRPMTGWNEPGKALPPSDLAADARTALDRRCGSTALASSAPAAAIRSAGWVPALHLDQVLARNDIEIMAGMTAASPGCEPTLFNLFVFAGGTFAGTVSPAMMAPSRDGMAGAVRFTGADAITVEFARYTPADTECCPSSRVRVTYRIEKAGAGPVLVATDARQVR
jgi:hypothetical protein